MDKLQQKYVYDIQAKDVIIAELKEVIQDMKSIYNAEVDALIGEKSKVQICKSLAVS